MRVLTVGETMALLDGVEGGGFGLGSRFRLRVAGAESNFAVALVRLGVDVRWVSRLGTDPFGDLVVSTLSGEGVDLGYVLRDDAPTGVFFKWHEGAASRVAYRRAGSAASRLGPGDVPDEALDGVRLVHLSGITMALSDGARETVLSVARRAREREITVSFDPNYRPALWRGPREAEARQRDVLPLVDWYLCGQEEGSLLFGTSSPGELRDAVRSAGAGDVAIRLGERGALVWEGVDAVEVPPVRLEDVVDEVGAGDGFAAGFCYGLLHAWTPARCARTGNVIAASALRGTGDWETFPRRGEVDL
jgi:2-dehydro-3-deoxygluconokinase